jgi:hypothetical protein
VRLHGLLLFVAIFVAGCSGSQSAPTAPAGKTGSVTPTTEKPWTNAAPTPSPPNPAQLLAPINAAMVLCSHVMNLTPCGLVTSSANDVMVCFSGCQTQIDTVVMLTVEKAAETCASSPPPEDAPRACELSFPPSAAIDRPAIDKQCTDRCEELVASARQ